MNSEILNIFVVHYKKLTDRKKYLLSVFDKLKDLMPIKIHFFEDIDRDTMSTEQLNMYKYNPDQWNRMNSIWKETMSSPRQLNNAEIACAVTHIEIYKYIKDNGINQALILEDDSVIPNNITLQHFVDLVSNILNDLPKDFDLCWISDAFGWTVENYTNKDPVKMKQMHINSYLGSLNQNIIFEDKYVYPMPCNKTTDAYFISNKCASFLFDKIVPFSLPIDWNHTPIILEYKLKNYWTKDTIITQGSQTVYKSSTQNITSIPSSIPSIPSIFPIPSLSSSTIYQLSSQYQQNSIYPINQYKQPSIKEILNYRTLTTEYPDTIHQKLEENSSKDLEYFINRIKNNHNFNLVKFGDGEFRNMISKNENEHNCDNCNYFEGLGIDLIKSYVYFLQDTNSFINRWCSHTYDIQRSMDNTYNISNQTDKITYTTGKFVFYDLLVHKIPFNKNIISFFKEIKNSNRYKIYVSNSQNIISVSNILALDEGFVIPEVNSYLDKNEIIRLLKKVISVQKDAIIMFSGGMFAKVLIKECHEICPYNTYIDIGSTFDGLHKYSRDFNSNSMYRQLLINSYTPTPMPLPSPTIQDSIPTPTPLVPKKYNILFEGWIGIPHSYALIFVNKICALYNNYNSKINFYLLEREYYNPEWNTIKYNIPEYQKKILSYMKKITKSDTENLDIDLIYSVVFPYDINIVQNKTVQNKTVQNKTVQNKTVQNKTVQNVKKCVFYTAEFKLLTDTYFNGPISNLLDKSIWLTGPSKWSTSSLSGIIPDTRNKTISHGVDSTVFYKDPVSRKQFRSKFGIKDDDILLLNIGSMTGNKNIISVILSFYNILIIQNSQLIPKTIKLILKGSNSLYNSSKLLKDTLSGINFGTIDISKFIENNIIFIYDTLINDELRSVYNGADIYVGPYLAEGFSLTHLEALFCQLKIIVPSTGSTEDYIEDILTNCKNSEKLIYKVPSTIVKNSSNSQYLNNIKLEDLTDVLLNCINTSQPSSQPSSESLNYIHEKYSWNAISHELYNYFESIIKDCS